MEMKITYDSEADAVYFYFKEITSGEVTNTISLNNNLNIDLDKDGVTLGIEILDATKNLPKEILKSANLISN
jgi:uncharacterized protein YuzE